MKTIAIWVLRHLLIPVGFVWTTGIFSVDFNTDTAHKDAMGSFTMEEFSTLEITPGTIRAYSDSLIQTRKQHITETGIYDPYLYFKDLKQYTMFEKLYWDSLNQTSQGKGIILSFLGGFSVSGKGQLANIRDDNWRHVTGRNFVNQRNQKLMGIEEARGYWFPAEASKDAKITKEPPTNFWKDIVIPFLLWLLGIYLKGLPIALLLFVIWKTKFRKQYSEASYCIEKNELPFRVISLSFILSAIIWPIILWKDIKNRANDALRGAEFLSRRKNMFSLLSTSDQKLIEIGKKMSLKEFRAHLESIGLRRKHSFAYALCVTAFLILLPRIMIPAVIASDVQVTSVTSVHHQIDHDVGWHIHADQIQLEAMVPEKEKYIQIIINIIHLPYQIIKILSGYIPDIWFVPRSFSLVSNIIQIKLLTFKNKLNEKYNNNYFNGFDYSCVQSN